MKSQVLANFSEIYLPIIALLIFVSVFVVMLLMINRKGSKQLYSEIDKIPLEEGKKYEK